MNILVYTGPGTNAHSINHTLATLKCIVGRFYDIIPVDHATLRKSAWIQNTALLVVPGGKDVGYVEHLIHKDGDVGGGAAIGATPKGDHSGDVAHQDVSTITTYISKGGRYLGISAGAYFACQDIHFAKNTNHEILGKRLGICGCTGVNAFAYDAKHPVGGVVDVVCDHVLVGDEEIQEAGDGHDTREKSTSQPRIAQMTKIPFYYNGGPYFSFSSLPSTLTSTSSSTSTSTSSSAVHASQSQESQQNITVLATYADTKNIQDSPAIVECSYGDGKAILSGVHIEFDPVMELLSGLNGVGYNNSNPQAVEHLSTINGLDPTSMQLLMETSAQRMNVFRNILKRLGIRVHALQDVQSVHDVITIQKPTFMVLCCHDNFVMHSHNDTINHTNDTEGSEYHASQSPTMYSPFNPHNIIHELTNDTEMIADSFQRVVKDMDTFLVSKYATSQTYLFEQIRLAIVQSDSGTISNPDSSVNTPTSSTSKDGTKQILHLIPVSNHLLPTLKLNFDITEYFASLGKELDERVYPFGACLVYADVMQSTQSLCDRNHTLTKSLPSGTLILASHQLSGRGRGSNSWVSTSPTSCDCLQFSLLLRHKNGRNVVWIQYLFGMAVVRALKRMMMPFGSEEMKTMEHTGKLPYEWLPVYLKWPNDIYAKRNGKLLKIGGILVTSSWMNGEFTLVVGCGLNVNNSEPTTCINDLIRDYNQTTSHTPLPTLTSPQVLASIMTTFSELYEQFNHSSLCNTTNPFDEFKDEYERYWIHQGQRVTLQDQGNKTVEIVGLGENGTLWTRSVGDGDGDGDGHDKGEREEFFLQPDGNSFDMMHGMISRKK